tara:strand:+ start:730 stop:939 length:210 start_codon:yes stop_codon:yes gene_type:complete
MVRSGEAVVAQVGMQVVAVEVLAGRACEGVGVVVEANNAIGNLRVYWEDSADITLWTRGGFEGVDLVLA